MRVAPLPFLMLCFVLVPSVTRADGWQLVVAGGGEAWPVAPTPSGNGFLLVDAQRRDVAGGRLHLLYNTDTVHVGLEGMRLADGKLEVSVVARGEALLAGLLFAYYQRGDRNDDRSFHASYAQLLPSLKWHPAPHHSIELVLGVRQWFFGRLGSTDDAFVLPPDTFVFEPRLGYTYWHVQAESREWEAHRFFPRITGFTFGVQLGLDRRSDRRAWGAQVGTGLDPRNDPDAVVLMVRQWIYGGVGLGSLARLQLEQHGSWGEGEDDLTRNRVGGMNPYVIPIAGLPWAALLSERLFAAQVALHLRLGAESPHELGLAVSGGAFNDVRRIGELRSFGGAGGASVFADLRFGAWQLNARVGWSFPAPWQLDPPHVSALLTLGARAF